MRPGDPGAGEPDYKSLFEMMMGMTAEDWDALGEEEVDVTSDT